MLGAQRSLFSSLFAPHMSAFDPKRTLGLISILRPFVCVSVALLQARRACGRYEFMPKLFRPGGDCMRRCAAFVGAVSVATAAGLLLFSARAADNQTNVLQRLSQLRDRAQVTQPAAAAVHSPGDAVVTGFSGVRPPQQVAPGVNPLDKTFIDLDGPSVRVIDLSNPGAPPQGQIMPAPIPFTVAARQVGQVFAVAQDDATPPNIYVAATSAYGLPIVAAQSDRDGTLRRLRRGEAGAQFMPGLFGPQAAGGGAGSIWKIDGRTGAVSLFANIQNSGAGLGDIAFDPEHRQFFVSDRASGLIHRIGLDGVARGTFDHGTAGRGAVGLAPVPDRPERRVNIQIPTFDPGDPQSWNYPAPARRTFALAVFQHRLFYAVAEGPQVWSVGFTHDGDFAGNASWELSAPPRPTEIASILFDAEKQIYLAERSAPTGVYDFKALAVAGDARVLRYRLRQPSDIPGPGRWAPVPDEYAVGFRPNYRNTNGGLAFGYRYTQSNTFGGCGGTLWTTGEQLRVANDSALAQQLAASGPLALHGVQGVAVDLLRPRNVPPLASLFANYDERIPESITREQTGHMGDMAIWQSCGAPPPQLALTCPIGFYWNGFTRICELPVVAGAACPPNLWWDGALCVAITCPADQQWDGRVCVCPANATWNGRRCVRPPRLCPEGTTWDESGQRCVPPRSPCPVEGCRPPPSCNMPGQILDNGECVCPPGQHLTRGGCVCPRGEYWNGTTCDPNTNGPGVNPPPSDGQPVTPCPPDQLCPINPPGDQQGNCPRGQIQRGDLCIVVDPAPEPPADQCSSDRIFDYVQKRCVCRSFYEVNGVCQPPPPRGDFTPSPDFCQGGPFKLVGGTCCLGNYICTPKPAVCPSFTEYELGPPWSSSPVCCRTATTGACALPPQQPDSPQCEPVGESRFDRCSRLFPSDPISANLNFSLCMLGRTNACFRNSDCAEGACCGRDGYCRAAGTSTTSVPPPPATGACPPSMIRVGETCSCPEGQTYQGDRCVPACTSGRVWNGEFCVCPNNGTWTGTSCATTSEQTRERPQCRKGTRWNGEACVPIRTQPKCKRGTRWDGERCRPISRPPSTPGAESQTTPGFSIGIGIGGGGGRSNRGPRGPGSGTRPPSGGGGLAN